MDHEIIVQDAALQRNKLLDFTKTLTQIFGSKDTQAEGDTIVMDVWIAWLLAHPLESVGGLAILSALIGVLLIPRVHELADQGHPRC